MKKRTEHRGTPLLVATAVLVGLILFLGSGPVWADGPPAKLGDRVWKDLNGNGVQDCTDSNGNGIIGDAGDDGDECQAAGIPGVRVNLREVEQGNCVEVIRSLVTNNSGFYLFGGPVDPGGDLDPGNYCVEFVLDTVPAGVCEFGAPRFTKQNIGDNDTVDSDADPVTGFTTVITLDEGETNLTVDAGIVCPLPCSIGDFVFEDANADGCQDSDERPIEGVVVKLFENCASPTEITSATTNANGFYEFTGLDCGKDYRVQFGDAGGVYSYTEANSCTDGDPNVPADEKDSDCSQEDGFSGCVTFPDPENKPNDPTIDCGYVCKGEIGDYVWLDENVDGCQVGDSGIVGIPVTLSEDCNERNFLKTVTTNSDGLYKFTGLCPGEYFVEFGNGSNTAPGQSCDSNPVESDKKDSNCGDPELQCVVLTPDNMVDNTIDCGKVECQLVVEKEAIPENIECIDTGTDGVGDDDCICPCVDSGTDTGTDGEPACIVEKVTYTYTITNTGKAALSDVTVFDNKFGTVLVEFTELAPGASETVKVEGVCLCEETTNKVTVTGKLPNGELCTAMDEATVTTDLDCIDTGTDGY